MKGIIKLFKRFMPPYKKYVVLSFLFNIITAILNVFSMGTIIPILQVLFKVNTKSYEFIAWNTQGESIIDITLNNANWYFSQMIETHGGSKTLMILAAALVLLTLLKTGTAY